MVPYAIMSSILIKILCIWYGFFSIFLFTLYGVDKAQSKINGRRIPEKTLHLLSIAGGFLGGLIGMQFFHHKTRKPIFLVILLVSLITHLSILLTVFCYR